MRKLPRIVWELLILLLLAAVGWGFWVWNERGAAQRLATAQEELRAELAAERQKNAEVMRQLAQREVEGVARAFAAGVRGEVLADEREAVDAALAELLLVSGVAFVHVLDADGGVIATSDRKLVATGRAGPRAAWALGATELQTRAGTEATASEAAVPFRSDDATVAVLWVGYEAGEGHGPGHDGTSEETPPSGAT